MNRIKFTGKAAYAAPDFELLAIAVQHGFALSQEDSATNAVPDYYGEHDLGEA